MRKLTFRIRALTYEFKTYLKINKNQLDVDIKLVRLYARLGNYKRSIFYAENIFYRHEFKEIGFVLSNLYLLNGEFDKAKEILGENIPLSDDFIYSVDWINDCINYDQVFLYISQYLRGKKAKASFINVINKGKALKNKSKSEIHLLENQDLYQLGRSSWCKGLKAPEYIRKIYNNYDISKVFETSVPLLKSTKIVSRELDNGLCSVNGGLRTTMHQPTFVKHRIMVFGASTTYGVGSSDNDTIPSVIQNRLNEVYEDIKVENHGTIGMNLLLAINNLLQTEINPDDIVLFFDFDEFREISSKKIDKIDLNNIERKNDFFIDLSKHQCHFSPRGNEVIANIICDEFLFDVIDNDLPVNEDVCLDEKVISVLDNFKYFLYKQTAKTFENCEMKSYLSLLESHVPDAELKVGSVAVNCNPITKGHLHLLEHASRSVDKLFIFVIEEDKSFFKFEDRLHLVAESTKHLENVTVLRGGKFICTELTYPDYFDKDTTEAKADASMEAWFFCEYIAKTLNITKIFLGDEPKCMITKQYNEKMQELLPEYGIEVDIIDRIATNGDVISASKVRKLLEVGDFDGIAQIVPEPTLLFLQENYGKSAA